ncbi:MAG: dTDP-4-amino-4,6-dideoxygalactose transaminase [Candidatus Cloacimonetes bacterium]|nr:dTDP-4-amino-4,6-dideoxygalactose transaminase [Candidatus Cloacimonadota bacterium]
MKIPFNKPLVLGSEIEYLKQVIGKDRFSEKGEFSNKCAQLLEKKTFCNKVIMTPSCTSALEMCALLCNIKPGDEVIMPSFTHPGTANPFVRAGAEIVWCDIKEDTKNIDENKIEPLITSKTKAIIVVHYGGVICRMDKITSICNKNHLFLIEDAAMSIGCRFKEKHAGSFGDLAVISFHKTKNVQCGEGGALLINNQNMIERAEFLRDYGTNRIHFKKGLVEKYTWIEKSSNFSMSELQAAFLYQQLLELKRINENRLRTWKLYYKLLSIFLDEEFLPCIPKDVKHNAHLFYLMLKNEEQRKELIIYLKSAGIQAFFHYVPLHSAPIWKGKYDDIHLPVTNKVSETLLRLPLYYSMQKEEVEYVMQMLQKSFSPSVLSSKAGIN